MLPEAKQELAGDKAPTNGSQAQAQIVLSVEGEDGGQRGTEPP